MPSNITAFLRTTEPDPDVLAAGLELVKGHARIPVSYNGYDLMLTNYIRSAESMLEAQADIAIRPQKWTLYLSELPALCRRYRTERLTLEPITAIDSVSYYDTDNELQEWSDTNYALLPGHPPRLFIKGTVSIPTAFDRPDAWQVVVSAGSDVIRPEAETFIAIVAAYTFRNPEDQSKMPSDTASRRLLDNLVDALRWRVYP